MFWCNKLSLAGSRYSTNYHRLGAMIAAIASDAGRKMDAQTATKLATSVISGSAAYLGGCKVLTFSLHLIPGLGSLGSVTINVILNAVYTIRFGSFVAQHMENERFDINDFNLLTTEMAAIVFAVPSISEVKETWGAYQDYQRSKR